MVPLFWNVEGRWGERTVVCPAGHDELMVIPVLLPFLNHKLPLECPLLLFQRGVGVVTEVSLRAVWEALEPKNESPSCTVDPNWYCTMPAGQTFSPSYTNSSSGLRWKGIRSVCGRTKKKKP